MPLGDEYSIDNKLSSDGLFDGLDSGIDEDDDIPLAVTARPSLKNVTSNEIQRYITIKRSDIIMGSTPLNPGSPL